MNKKLLALATVFGLGCGSTVPTQVATTPNAHPETNVEQSSGDVLVADFDSDLVPVTVEDTTLDAPEGELPSFNARRLRRLPVAPWTEGTVAAADVDDSTMQTWAAAGNREWCSPLVVAGESHARATDLEGGWTLEFDAPGAPGMNAEGETCADCGHASFGVAGTSLGVSDAMPEPAPAFADGSVAEISEEDGVASALIAVPGQSCVYQVWSFQGREHLESLIGGLRFVDVNANGEQLAGLDVVE